MTVQSTGDPENTYRIIKRVTEGGQKKWQEQNRTAGRKPAAEGSP